MLTPRSSARAAPSETWVNSFRNPVHPATSAAHQAINPRQQLVHRCPQDEQARRLVELVQGGQDGSVMPVDGLDPHGVVVPEPVGDGPVGAVEVLGELGDLTVRVEVVTEARCDLAAGGFPLRAVQQPGTRVGPARLTGA